MNSQISITEPVILIRPVRLYYDGIGREELYEITRGIWRLSKRRENAVYAFTVINYKVMAAYRIYSWHEPLTTEFHLRKDRNDRTKEMLAGRIEFLGRQDREMEDKYLGVDLSRYFSRGNSNPVRYVNC